MLILLSASRRFTRTTRRIIAAVREAEVEFADEHWGDVSKAIALIRACLDRDPRKRPTATRALAGSAGGAPAAGGGEDEEAVAEEDEEAAEEAAAVEAAAAALSARLNVQEDDTAEPRRRRRRKRRRRQCGALSPPRPPR